MWTSKCKGRKNNGTKNKKNSPVQWERTRIKLKVTFFVEWSRTKDFKSYYASEAQNPLKPRREITTLPIKKHKYVVSRVKIGFWSLYHGSATIAHKWPLFLTPLQLQWPILKTNSQFESHSTPDYCLLRYRMLLTTTKSVQTKSFFPWILSKSQLAHYYNNIKKKSIHYSYSY